MRGVKVFPFTSFQQLLDYVVGRKGILVAINAEKILHATHQTRDIINRNIGYCDGVGAVMALRKHGHKDVSSCYFTWHPGTTSPCGPITTRLPSAFSAERIMPCDSTPFSLRGSKLAMKHTSLPTRSSGL